MEMVKVSATDAFQEWFDDLRDFTAMKAVKARIARMKIGNFGDWKNIDGVKNLFEARIDVSKGYRLYYTKKGNTVVILLCCGIKDKQKRNIREAQHILKNLEL